MKIALWVLFGLMGLRFVFPFISNPVDHLFADTMHHWLSAEHLLAPTVMDAINPKMYQLYLFVLRGISQDNAVVIAFFTGLLCASLPYFWYRAAREILPKMAAIVVGLLVATCPTLWTIYAYFMNETLLLNLMGLAVWMSLRAMRKQTLWAFAVAVLCFVLAMHTRAVALPFAVFFIVLMVGKNWLVSREKRAEAMGKLMKQGVVTVLLVVVCAVPASLHSHLTLKLYAPYGYTKIAEIYRKHGSVGVEYKTYAHEGAEKEGHLFMGPNVYGRNIGAPFFEFKSDRDVGFYRWEVDLSKGRADWDAALAKIDYGSEKYWRDVKENALFFFLGYSWPEVPVPMWKLREGAKEQVDYPAIIEQYQLHYRWLWGVFVLVMLALVWRMPMGIAKLLVMGTLLLTLMFIMQDVGLVTGRFRKPFEPFILLSFVAVLTARKGKKG